jgi:pantetheine-phosphate adenylyltransferase
MCKKAIYPGTFDPVTYGHIDIIQRAREIFPEIIVAVADNPYKKPLFPVEKRVELLREVCPKLKGVTICSFGGLVVDFAHQQKVNVLIRGVRMFSDFEYEFSMALSNRKLAPDIETIFLMPQETFSYTSSRLLREAASLGADLSPFLPALVEKALKERLASTS